METSNEQCSTHSRPLEAFCSTCKACICYKCGALAHKNHEVHDLSEVIQQLLKDLTKETENSKKTVVDIEKAVDNVRKRSLEVSQQEQDAISKVKKIFNIIREECDKREQLLISEIQGVVSQKVTILNEQVAQLQTTQLNLGTLQESALR
jgi:hypothetical protein